MLRGRSIIGLIAGVLGTVASLLSISTKSTLPDNIKIESASLFYESGILALICSIIGLVGAWAVYHNKKLGGFLMIVAGVGGFIFLTYTYILSTILFFGVGLQYLLSKQVRS